LVLGQPGQHARLRLLQERFGIEVQPPTAKDY
jgi:hypothetical protein